ncbi:EamA family transporter [Roseobacter sp. HKCCD9010]|uniref:DMT family transporter n=1 Tax=unclassified Roseobacter TaxID=196798 RepID=UPI0014909EC4|nr:MULTISPECIES: DMT family transporter [unclassified Roseobacter]MBF9048751.1 EamA family transporter [Rhodobacterales bacterium HKCCD4356]NNV10750.1 EamA family transporter [Roseobacter sp. HKCCD7357]NNV14935.1 EamA family transporter [Roseobacter sp. HKCCD8768]NNV24394.1 EamA family transporter [Roseobacter sp. HKCCD8192]NNV28651.1 EamA family transporter [Roseobacter sp. HKCCD9061]
MTPFRGIALKIASVCVFMTMASLIKSVSDTVPAGQAVFFRSICALPVIVVWLLYRQELHIGLKTQNPIGHVWRGLVGTMAMGLGFAGLGLLPLPEVTAIGYAAPLLVVIFAAMFLGEEVRAFRLSVVALGLVGVLIVLSPRLQVGVSGADTRETLGAVVVLMGAICAALAQVFVRKLVQTEGTAAIVFWFSVTASTLSLLTIPGGWVMPSPVQIVMLVLAGLLGGFGQILLTSSYRHADASLIAPFEYTSMLLALGVGYLIFDEIPTLTMLGGAVIIILAGVLIIWRERQLGMARARQRKAMTPQG